MFAVAILNNKEKRSSESKIIFEFQNAEASRFYARESNLLEPLGTQEAVKWNTGTNYVRTNEN
jgi:hypothetical protein